MIIDGLRLRFQASSLAWPWSRVGMGPTWGGNMLQTSRHHGNQHWQTNSMFVIFLMGNFEN